jgi:hypothetical protein
MMANNKFLSIMEPISWSDKVLENISKPSLSILPFPQCALCNKQVERFESEDDYMENTILYKARCHGRSEVKAISRSQLGLSDDGLRRVLNVFFIEDAAALGRPSRPPLSSLKKNYEHPKPESPRPDYVHPDRPKRMLDK